MEDTGWRRNKWGGWFNIYEDRYVGGKKVSVKKGQKLSDAMKESGKFNKKDSEKPEDNEKAKLNDEIEKKIRETETNTEHDEKNDSLAKFTDKNGKLKPEREVVHERIIREYLEGKTPVPEGEEKLYYMTGGGSGTGKSTFVKDSKQYFGKNVDKNMIKIDADDIKAKLYQYGKEMNNDRRRFSASYLHEESSALSKRINTISTDMGYHTMLDSTGDGKPSKLKGKIDEAHNKGYKVVACYGTCDFEKGLENNLNRYIAKARVNDPTARYVNEVDVLDLHRGVSNTLIEDAKYFDKVDLYDMNDFSNKKKIASGGNGKGLTIEKGYEKEYNSFKNKGNLTDDQLKMMVKDYVKEANKRVKELGVKRIKRERGDYMLSASQKNKCLMIAKGTLKENELEKPLNEEEKERVELYKEIYDLRKKEKLYDLVDAMMVDE